MGLGSRACLPLLAWFTAWSIASAAFAASKSAEAERSRAKSKQSEAEHAPQAKNGEGTERKAGRQAEGEAEPEQREQSRERSEKERTQAEQDAAEKEEARRQAAEGKQVEDDEASDDEAQASDDDEAQASDDEARASDDEAQASDDEAQASDDDEARASDDEAQALPPKAAADLAAAPAEAAFQAAALGTTALGTTQARSAGNGEAFSPAQPDLPELGAEAEVPDGEAADGTDSAATAAEPELVATDGEASVSTGNDVVGAEPAVVGTLDGMGPPDSEREASASGPSTLPARLELQVAEGVVAEGTRWETEYFSLESQRSGPTVIIISGMHGDELAGPLAADRLRSVELCAGALYVLPRANVPALEVGKRRTPDAEHEDLNRNFPRAPDEQPRGEMAAHLWEWVESLSPEVLLDLHEGVNYHAKSGRSVGNTILFVANERSRYLAMRMVVAANRLEPNHEQRFRPWKPPVIGGIARAASDQLGAMGMILETTRKGPLERRVEQHWTMVTTLLDDLDMTGSACDMPLPEPSTLTAED